MDLYDQIWDAVGSVAEGDVFYLVTLTDKERTITAFANRQGRQKLWRLWKPTGVNKHGMTGFDVFAVGLGSPLKFERKAYFDVNRPGDRAFVEGLKEAAKEKRHYRLK